MLQRLATLGTGVASSGQAIRQFRNEQESGPELTFAKTFGAVTMGGGGGEFGQTAVLATLLLFSNPDFKPFLIYLSGVSPSDSFDEALADMIHDGVYDLRNDLSKGHHEKDETKKVWFHSLTSILGRDTPPERSTLGGFSHQEPITGSEQFPCACVTAFSHTRLLLERFLARILNLINSTNQSVKPTDLKITFVAF